MVSGNSSVGVLIEFANATGNRLIDNQIGTDVTGKLSLGNQVGVTIQNDAQNNTIGGDEPGTGNLISGNRDDGIWLLSSNNVVVGNLIGTDIDGTAKLSNAGDGIDITASGNRIGGLTAGARNVISGNQNNGVLIETVTATGNLVQGNYIGTDITGTLSLGNGTSPSVGVGVGILDASDNVVGGTEAGARNIISGNASVGVNIRGVSATSNIVQGNYLGTDVTGKFARPNDRGVVISNDASGNKVGGTEPGAGNVISGNTGDGMQITGSYNTVQGNLIGTDKDGLTRISNADGIDISGANNLVGGTTAAARNIISGNRSNGILIETVGATGNRVQGNFIGTDIAGTGEIGNGADGLGPFSGVGILDASRNVIGGATENERNVISGNRFSVGVLVNGLEATNNVVKGNYIGTDSTGEAALPNERGVVIENGASDNRVGESGVGNLISGNLNDGIQIIVIGSTNNVVEGNLIGTDFDGNADVGNGGDGITITTSDNFIGGDTPGAGNVISGNEGHGIIILGSGASGNFVRGNYVGTDITGTADLGNAINGVQVSDASANTIGGVSQNSGNVISGNELFGIYVTGESATDNLIQGNLVGTDRSGTVDVGNAFTGIVIESRGNTVGGPSPEARNVASGNDAYGVYLTADATENVIQGNFIGTSVSGLVGVRNDLGGVVAAGASSNRFLDNVVSGNGIPSTGLGDGFQIYGTLDGAGNNNILQGNLFGTDAQGRSAIGNEAEGIQVSSSDNQIGGSGPGEGNLVANNRNGILLLNAEATGNVVQGNLVGTEITGAVAQGNLRGIAITRASGNLIGGSEPGAGNVISGNLAEGMLINDGSNGNTVQGNLVGTDVTGTVAVGNLEEGIRVNESSENVLRGNVVSGNAGHGVLIEVFPTAADRNVVQGNFIGTNSSGADLKNLRDGVRIAGGGENVIGGTAPGEPNNIAFNALAGVAVLEGTGNAIRGNSIASNGGLGIDLGASGPNPNDPGDADTGPNNLHNSPEIAAPIFLIEDELEITYSVPSDPANAAYPQRVELFLADEGGDEGQLLLGTDEYAVSEFTEGAKTIVIPRGSVFPGDRVVATATDAAGNTSEFSLPATVLGSLTLTVTNTDNAGPGSLRRAIEDANTNPGLDIIEFSIGTGVQTIRPTAALPAIIDSVFIDGSTQPGFSGSPIIEISGSDVLDAGEGTDGFFISADDSLLRGLVINGFSDDGIEITGDNNTIQGSYVGTNVAGDADLGNAGDGIQLSAAVGTRIGGTLEEQGNLISGNDANGIFITATSSQNVVLGNLIGVNQAGDEKLPNFFDGILISSAPQNVIGGSQPGARNVIAGNGAQGVEIQGTRATGNLVAGNFIGTNASGSPNLGNGALSADGHGVTILNAPGNIVGGGGETARNVISGNAFGVVIMGVDATNNEISGNYIGINSAGDGILGNVNQGVLIKDAANNNTVGGTTAALRNVISGNRNGIEIEGVGSFGNRVQGNFIGTDAAGMNAVANSDYGVFVNDAPQNVIGGTDPGARNVVSGNEDYGVYIVGSNATQNDVQGNYVGTQTNGLSALGNAMDGIRLTNGAHGNRIGGESAGAGNLISGNVNHGISINGTGVAENEVLGNLIGTNAIGTARVPNEMNGISITDSAADNLIGGASLAARNVISGNTQAGVLISRSASENRIEGNLIGTTITGTDTLGNRGGGVVVDSGAFDNAIGGTAGGAGNVISGNDGSGVVIANGSTGNVVLANLIGTKLDGSQALGNGDSGVDIRDSSGNRIGGTSDDAQNTISANSLYGIRITGVTATDNLIQGNYIGTDVTGTVDLGNAIEGVEIFDASDNTIGGAAPGAGNLISGNNNNGVVIFGVSSTNNVVQGNLIGTNADGTTSLNNQGNGVLIVDGSNNKIGGTDVGSRNIISGNGGEGVGISGASATGNEVLGNYIGTDIIGTVQLGNGTVGDGWGVAISSGSNNVVGGLSSSARNIISGNDGGVQIGGTQLRRKITFESIPDVIPLEGLVISEQFLTSHGVSFAFEDGGFPILAEVGSPLTAFGGPGDDQPAAGQNVGSFFLTDDGVVGEPPAPLLISYERPVSETSGVIVDVDGDTTSGFEQWTIEIRDESDFVLDTVVVNPDDVPGDSEGRAIPWEFNRPSDDIRSVRIVYTGSKTSGVGFAYDNIEAPETVPTDNIVQGNYIGTDVTGIVDLGNLAHGVMILDGERNVIGGSTAVARNIIAGSDIHGVLIQGPNSADNFVQGNWIGRNVLGDALGNSGDGVRINDASRNEVGGVNGAANNIAFNAAGVVVVGGTDNLIQRNAFSDHGGLAIDLGADGTTANDAGDADAGPNNLQNSPAFSAAEVQSDGTTEVTYMVASDPAYVAYPLTIEFVLAAADEPEGRPFISSATFSESDFISGSQAVTIAQGQLFPGDHILATATDANDNTSEFSAPFEVTSSSTIIVTNANDSGAGSLRQAITDANNNPGLDLIEFDLPTPGPYTIQLVAPLDPITDTVVIDGRTQPGYAGLPIIELDGSGAGGIGTNGLSLQADNSLIRALIINRFTSAGIVITGDDNVVEGNFIGTDATGAVDLGNGAGIRIENASDNRIGGTTPEARNLISANDSAGIQFVGTTSSGNLIQGNFIGTDVNGMVDLGNATSGVIIADGSGNTVGGDVPGARNVISGNDINGVFINGATASGNFIQGNFIGTNLTANAALGNSSHGVVINSPNNTVGGSNASQRNVISGNLGRGVDVSGIAATGNVIAGNFIGTDILGTADLGNAFSGVAVVAASNNTIGGATPDERNVISGNDANGIHMLGGSNNNIVQGNYIGTDVTGTVALGNQVDGVDITGAPNNLIGGSTSMLRNVISGNFGYGVELRGSESAGNRVAGNYIGIDVTGIAPIGNRLSGVLINDAPSNTIGGSTPGERNVISDSIFNGVVIVGAAASMNQIQGNYIGTDATGSRALGNDVYGIFVADAPENTIGGLSSAAGNLISGNLQHGIFISSSADVVVQNNLIGTDLSGAAGLGNGSTGDGIVVLNSTGTIIGGTDTGNLISGHWNNGISINGVASTGTIVQGNLIGVSRSGNLALPNAANGVLINGSPGNTLGGTTVAARNIISGNLLSGVVVRGELAQNNIIQGNYLGTDPAGENPIGNTFDGVLLENAPNNTIGGTAPGSGNLISGNLDDGITVFGLTATNNVIQGNFIGTNHSGTSDLGNTNYGVFVTNSPGNLIGGLVNSARNLISGNDLAGVLIADTASTNNTVLGNLIGTDVNGTAPLGNNDGVEIISASNNIVGGTTAAARNVISGNKNHGVNIFGVAATGNQIQGNWIGTNINGDEDLGNVGNGVHKTQYFEMMGQWALYHEGWLLSTKVNRAPWEAFGAANPDPLNNQVFQLYDLTKDFTQSNDIAAQNPQKVEEMRKMFLEEAKKYQVLPLDASVAARIVAPRPNITAGRTEFVYTHPMVGLPQGDSPFLLDSSYTIAAEITVPEGGAEGMILTSGGRFAGYGFYLLKGKPVFLWNLLDLERLKW